MQRYSILLNGSKHYASVDNDTVQESTLAPIRSLPWLAAQATIANLSGKNAFSISPLRPGEEPTLWVNRPTDRPLQIEMAVPKMADDVRRVIVANAHYIRDVEAGDKATRPLLEELLGPVKGKWDLDRPFRVWKEGDKYRTQGVSTCGLVAEGLWRWSGVDAIWLYEQYVFGAAISRAVRFAQIHQAWQRPTDGLVPEPGDYVVIGEGLAQHALTCIGWEDGGMLVSIDGGQTGARGLQAVHRVTRPWREGATPYLGNRKVYGWAKPDLLPYRKLCIAPENWASVEV